MNTSNEPRVQVFRKERDFTQIDNPVLRDSRLSLQALGLLVNLLSHSDDWVISFWAIQQERRLTKEALQKIFKELAGFGYAELVVQRNTRGQVIGSRWNVHEVPIHRELEKPAAGETSTIRTPLHKNTNYIYTDKVNTDNEAEDGNGVPSPLCGIKDKLNDQKLDYNFVVERLDEAEVVAGQLPEDCRDLQLSMLRSLRQRTRPTYKTTAKKSRIYCHGPWQNFKGKVRKKLLQGTIGFDLAGCQFAVVSKLWGLKNVDSFLDGQLWERLAEQTGVSDKELLKETVYSALYGRTWTTAKGVFMEHLDIDEKAATSILRTPLLKQLFDARDARVRRIQAGEPLFDAWGEKLPTSTKQQILSSLSCQAQSYELKILEPAITTVLDRRIPCYLWLHDGFYCGPEVQPVINELVQQVDERASSLGIKTRLEVQQL